jgi:hypothetical protein
VNADPQVVSAIANSFALIGPEVILLLAACILFLGGTFNVSRQFCGIVALAALGLAGLALILSPSSETANRAELFAGPLVLDRLAVFVKVIALVGGAVLVLFSWNDVAERWAAEYQGCLLIIVVGTCLTGSANELVVHMDGARFANAIASLNCAPKAITWKVGVDALCFGGTKNGTAAGELVIFFNKEISREFDYRVKQAGQLGSKMRFLAAPWLGLVTDDVWLQNARHANRAARQLAQNLQRQANVEIVFPVEANAVFARMDDQLVQGLQARGWHFYKFIEPDVYRLMCSWATTESDIGDFIRDVILNH